MKSIQNERNSSIELLRIFAILFIISHHFLVHGMKLWEDISWSNYILLTLDSAFYVAVNCFVLISGYYSIRFDWKKLLRIYLLTAIIGGIGYLTHLIIDDATLGRSVIYNTVLCISHPPKTWFVQIYVFLFLFSPLINAALSSLDKGKMKQVLCLMTIVCVYIGWFWQDNVNKGGDNLINFIWCYCIGYYLKNYFKIDRFAKIYYLLIWILASCLNTVLSITIDSYIPRGHNNPLIMIAAINLFLFFRSFNFSSKYINIIAGSTLGVYLIHENTYLSRFLYRSDCVSFYQSNIFNFVLTVVGLFVICVLIDMTIRYLILNPCLTYIFKFKFLKKKDE